MSQDGSKSTEASGGILRDYVIAVLAAVTFALLIRFFVIEAYRIPSSSMRPALEPGDTLFVAKWPYGLRFPGQETPFLSGRAPARGEVVVFSPVDQTGQQRDFIKRVIAVAGDTVEIREGHVILNGKPLVQDTNQQAICRTETVDSRSYQACSEPPVMASMPAEKVPDGHIFVLGDMRTQAPEAKRDISWGLVPVAAVKGKALWIWLSIEPSGHHGGWFSRIRFERMMQRVS